MMKVQKVEDWFSHAAINEHTNFFTLCTLEAYFRPVDIGWICYTVADRCHNDSVESMLETELIILAYAVRDADIHGYTGAVTFE